MPAAHEKFRIPAAGHPENDPAAFIGQRVVRHVLYDNVLHSDRFACFRIQKRVAVKIPCEMIACAVITVFHMVQGGDERDVDFFHIRVCRKIRVRVEGKERTALRAFIIELFFRQPYVRICNFVRFMPENILVRNFRAVHAGAHVSAVFIRINIRPVETLDIRAAVMNINGIPFVLDQLEIDPGGTYRTRLFGKRVVEDGRQPRVQSFDHRFVYDIGGLDAVLRTAGGFVVDLDLNGPVFTVARKAGGGG